MDEGSYYVRMYRWGSPFRVALIIGENWDGRDILWPRFWIAIAVLGRYWGIVRR